MNEDSSQPLDKNKVRRSFGRAAPDYDSAAVLQHEIGRRMLERLDYIRLEPRVILDIGCGTGVATEALLKRYPKAEVMALDFALPMLERARRRGRWWRRPRCLCADLDHLPLVDLVPFTTLQAIQNQFAELVGESSVSLVVLNACETASTSNLFQGLAHKLLRRAVPAVIGIMRPPRARRIVLNRERGAARPPAPNGAG